MNIFRCPLCAVKRVLKGEYVFSWPRQPAIGGTSLRWATLILYGWLAALVVYPLLPWLAYIRPEQWLPLGGPPLLYGFVMLTYALRRASGAVSANHLFYTTAPQTIRKATREATA